MKFISSNKKLLSLILINSCFFYLLTTPHHGKKNVTPQSYVFSEAKIVQDAVSKIKKQLNEQRSGKPCLVSCTYKIHNNKPLKIDTKTYFSAYRKKPHFQSEIFTSVTNMTADKIIEVTYNKKNASSISITEKNRHNHAKSSKKIEIGHLL